ncbi:MAG: phospho-N-acetylmuramoyl-pentapeptide-transferase [Planctomycetes bacterium]|nr:phospho-N-acetylmuramoyl-pentapeptide-transferase [Planctomycetota bacterium]
MLYELLFGISGPRLDVPGVWLLQFISFRSVAAVLTAFLLALWLGRVTIRAFGGAGLGEDTGKSPSETLRALHAKKRGTPTMGGLFLIASMLASSLLWARFDRFNDYTLPGLALIAWFAVVGLVDDAAKAFVPFCTGIRGRIKQRWLTLGAVCGAVWVLAEGLGDAPAGGVPAEGLAAGPGPWLHVPFLTEPVLALGVAFGLPFVVLAVLVLTGTANAVNLTDGMDGLAIGCVITATLAYSAICYFVGRSDFSAYLHVEHVPGAGELTVVLGALLGASFAFLWFNAPPAQIFMGDVGSLPLGGGLGFAALVSRTEIVLVVVGGVFVVEALSVILQVWSWRKRGRRIFRCAPLHHHYQFGGMPETRIVVRTWLISALLALASLALFKIR